MVIVHVILSTRGISGSEKYVIDLIKYQNKKFKVFAITSKKNYKLNILLKKETKVFEIGSLFQKNNIKKILNQIDPQIVHCHLGRAAKKITKSKKYKIISTMHMNYKAKDYKNVDGIIVSNGTQFSEIKNTFRGQVFKSYLWVNLPKKNLKKNELKKKLNISKKNIIFGSIGRFHPQKGFDILIRCFKELNLKNCTLILIGNGHHEFSYLQNNDGKFKIIDHVKNVSNFYNIFDVALFASRWETFGFTLVEAMKFNLPILTSKHIGNKDWLNKFPVSQFEIDKIEKLKKLIKKLYNSRIKKKKYNLHMFDYKKNSENIIGIYKKMLVK